ncbi:MAG: hypothetical protein ACI4XP_03255 [Acutalibacteraceae bacterium]
MSARVSYTTKTDITKDMLRNIDNLNSQSIEVGVFEGENKWLAGIHEYGCNITPKNAQYLTVPCNPKAAGKKARDFSDLFFLRLDDGSKWLVRNKGKDQIEFMYALMTSVKIPERSFLRAGHDEHIDEILKKAEKAAGLVVEGKMSQQQYLNMIGQMLSTKIKTYARNLSSPPNSNLTTDVKGSSNPLVDTGNMIEGITYRIK